MHITVKAKNLHPQKGDANIDIEIPSKCPRCGIAYGKRPESSFVFQSERFPYDSISFAYAFYFCPHCGKCFLTEYRVIDEIFPNMLAQTSICQTYPSSTFKNVFPDEITKLSPAFVQIYHQAEQAENSGLSDICGLGYRKALEFLIKDFAIHEHPEAEATIKIASLAQCIKKYIDANNIKTLAEKSAWIGNDEVHYIRKQEERTVSDLKKFILASTYFISMTLTTEDAASILPL